MFCKNFMLILLCISAINFLLLAKCRKVVFNNEQRAMRVALFLAFIYFRYGHCIWPKGVVHFTINNKDYDLHSQEQIQNVLAQIEKEICVKFFHTPVNITAGHQQRVLHISNPQKLKNCPQNNFDYSRNVVDMTIGYRCFERKDIARVVVEMLRASIEPAQPINSYDLVNTFHQAEQDPSRPSLLAPSDRNYLAAHYHSECGALAAPAPAPARRLADDQEGYVSAATQEYYKDKLWPLGVVMYSVEWSLYTDPHRAYLVHALKAAMASIEYASCVVFQNLDTSDSVLDPINMLFFGNVGDEDPAFGFTAGNQTLDLEKFVNGAPGHNTHAVNNLMRVLGVPMMSNRYDRDNYVTINWHHVRKGKEHLLEKIPEVAWIRLVYDMASVTHASSNYMCDNSCYLGRQTVQPIQDHLWTNTMIMGHNRVLSDTDKQIVNLLYGKECERRYNIVTRTPI